MRSPEVFLGLPVDTDGFMRLVRVERLLETGAWQDGSVPRSNWPQGEVSHWTRPVDLLILALAAPVRLLTDTRTSVALGGILLSPLLHLAAALLLLRAAAPLVPGAARALVLPLFLLQAGVLSYGSPGRADHHMLIVLLHVLLLGAGIRMILEPRRAGPAWTAGALAAAGIWVSPEMLLPLALLFAVQGLVWGLEGGDHPRAGLRLAAGLAAGLAVALALERPGDALRTLEYDRISRVHVEMALVALLFWGGITTLSRDPPPGRGARWGWLLAGGPVLVGGFLLARPRFFQGPWVDVDPQVVAHWLRTVQELQPLFSGPWWRSGPEAVLFLAPAALALGFTAHRALRGEEARRRGWLYLLVSLAVYVPLAVAQVRFTALAGPLQAVAVAGLTGALLRRASGIVDGQRRRWARVGTLAAVIAGPLVAAMGVAAAGEVRGRTPVGAAPTAPAPGLPGGACPARVLTGILRAEGPEPATVLAFMDLGPRILYETPHRVLATPYHRNRDGILEARRLLRLPAGPDLRAGLEAHEVRFVVICPPDDRSYHDPPEGSLYRLLEEGTPPEGLRMIPLPPEAGAFRLAEVAASGG